MPMQLDGADGIDNQSLAINVMGAKAILNGILDLDSKEHMDNVVRAAFNRMAECLDPEKVSFIDTMKFNMLGILLEAGLNIEKATQLAQRNITHLEGLLEKRNAPPSSD